MSARQDGFGPSPRRKRLLLSCTECHRRKEKCDRRQPCKHCMKRGKRNACVYELDRGRVEKNRSGACEETKPWSSSAADHDSRSLGYANDAKGTPGIIRDLGGSNNLHQELRTWQGAGESQYACAIRELPSQKHIDFLVQAFFENVAWHYDMVDKATFASQLARWSSISYQQLKLAPRSLPDSLQAFPALLFHVLAQSLLFQPARHDKLLDDLKYAADMRLSDRAAEYADAGNRIASLFDKSNLNLTVVQATLMRACFEKTTGAVTQAWHSLGTAIRDAQELGLHRMKPGRSEVGTNVTSQRDIGRDMWLLLHLWDSHMGIVLGRPMATTLRPEDVPYANASDCVANAPEPPSPRDVLLCGYHTAYKFLPAIQELETVSDCHVIVDEIHTTIIANISNFPAWARPQRDRQYEPGWLTLALKSMTTNVYFVLFALHRPFIFASPSSRATAVYAATEILGSQARLFEQTGPLQHKAFGWIFSTFDAVVLIIAVYVRFPEEFIGQDAATKTSVEAALDRLKALRASNALASSAYRVVQRLYEKMLEAVHSSSQASSLDTGATNGSLVSCLNTASYDITLGFTDGVSAESEGMELSMLGSEWNDDLISNIESYMLPPEPFNELLTYVNSPFEGQSAQQNDSGQARVDAFGSSVGGEERNA